MGNLFSCIFSFYQYHLSSNIMIWRECCDGDQKNYSRYENWWNFDKFLGKKGATRIPGLRSLGEDIARSRLRAKHSGSQSFLIKVRRHIYVPPVFWQLSHSLSSKYDKIWVFLSKLTPPVTGRRSNWVNLQEMPVDIGRQIEKLSYYRQIHRTESDSLQIWQGTIRELRWTLIVRSEQFTCKVEILQWSHVHQADRDIV